LSAEPSAESGSLEPGADPDTHPNTLPKDAATSATPSGNGDSPFRARIPSRDKRDVLFITPFGVGRTHLARAIGYNALKVGFLVIYRSILDLVREFLRDETMAGEEG
jgi:hypothetical protein